MESSRVVTNEQEFFELTRRVCQESNISISLNFLFDAFKKIIPYDRIGIAVLERDKDGEQIVRYKNDELIVSVRDQGPGIAKEDLTKLFTAFGRLKTRPTGGEPSTGLGLFICKQIIEAHGGQIWVESTPGKGSIFSFSLPGIV